MYLLQKSITKPKSFNEPNCAGGILAKTSRRAGGVDAQPGANSLVWSFEIEPHTKANPNP